MLRQFRQSRWFGAALAALLFSAWSATEVRAFFPQSQPTFPPPTGVEPLPPIIIPDPPVPMIDPPPPVHGTPEPGTITLALLGAGIAGGIRRRKKANNAD
jgi:hypothetical protein